MKAFERAGTPVRGRSHPAWFCSRLVLVWLLLLGWLPRGTAETAQPVSVVKVLVLYTPQASTGAGGSTATLQLIDAAVVEANTVFQNSRINVRIQLALAAGINYAESGSVATDLAQLQNPGNGLLAEAHKLRDHWGADLVCLITETGDDWWFYGLQGPSAENAFSILRRPYLTGGYYFPVVLSFNFGCQLERGYADSMGAFPYAYGYSFVANGTPYSTADAFSNQRIPFFSNPEVLFQGVPLGVPPGLLNAADNALVMNQTAPIVAAFRGPATVTLPPRVTVLPPAAGAVVPAGTNLLLTVNATDPDGKVVRVDYYEGTNRLASTKSPPFRARWPQAPVGQHLVFAVAMDNAGASTISDPVAFTVVPANDEFAARTRITGVQSVVRADNTLASAEPGEPAHAGVPAAHSLWWTYTAPAGGVILLDATSSSFPPSLDVYTGNEVNDLTEVTSTLGVGESAVRFATVAGATYQIALDSPEGLTGSVEMALTFTPFPANDNFAHRRRLHGNQVKIYADNQGATREVGEPDHGGTPGCASLWWTWTAPADGQLTLSASQTTGTSLLLALYTGDGLANLVPAFTQTAYPSYLFTPVERGVTYQIAADSAVDPLVPGPFELDLSFVPEPKNDRFAGRTPIQGTWITLSNSSATATLEPGTPATGGLWYPTLWWSWTAPASGYATIGSPSGQFIDVFTGSSLTSLTSVAGGSPATFTTTAGVTYAIAATGFGPTVELSLALSTLRIVAPAEGASFTAGGNIVLSAAAMASDGPLTQVQFFANDQVVGTIRRSPYRVSWQNVPAGTYSLTAVGTDGLGRAHISPPVTITVQSPPPRNDNFVNRTVIRGSWISLTNSNIGATSEPGEPDIAGTYWGNSIWWTWTAPASGRVTLSTTSFLTAFGVYTGNAVSNLTAVAGGYSSVDFEATAGTTYNIAAVGWTGDVALQLALSNLRLVSPADGSVFTNGSNITLLAVATATEQVVHQVEFFHDGNSLGIVTNPPYTLTWTNVPGGVSLLVAVATDQAGHTRTSPTVTVQIRPANDDFTNAVVLAGQRAHAVGSTAGATTEPDEPRPAWAPQGSTVWYAWTAPTSGRYTIVVGAAWSWVYLLEVWTGADLPDLAPVGDIDTMGTATVLASPGTTYYLSVDSANDFTLDIGPVPANDNFTNAQVLTGANINVSGVNLMATVEPGEPDHTPWVPGGHSVWYAWTAPAGGLVTVAAAGTDYSTPVVDVYRGTNVAGLTAVGTNSSPASVSFLATAGATYAIAVDGSGGFFTLNLALTPPAGNDAFDSRYWLSGMNPTVQGSTLLATVELGEPGFSPWVTAGSVWYAWLAPADGTVRVHCPTEPCLVCRGGSISNLVVVAPPDPASFADLIFSATAGTEYDIAVASAPWLPADFTLSLVMPKAQIASPTNGAAFPPPASFAIVARTIDIDGAVVSVSFFDGTNRLACVTNAPFQIEYSPTAVGSHELSLQAVDQNGLTTTSEVVEVRVPPANDNFAQRMVLTGTATNWVADNGGATTEPGELLPGGASGRTLWWSWTAPTNGTVTFGATGFSSAPLAAIAASVVSGSSNTAAADGVSPNDVITINPWPPGAPGPTTGPLLALYTNATLSTLSLCASNSTWYIYYWSVDPTNGEVVPVGTWCVLPSFTFPVVRGQTYQLSLDGANGSFGIASMALSFAPAPFPPVNDNFSQATVLAGSSLAIAGTTVAATREFGEPSDGLDLAARTVWYAWTAPANGNVQVTATANTGSLAVAVYAGASLGNLIPVAANGNPVLFYALAGTTYKIVVAGASGLATDFSLNLAGPPVPPAIDPSHTVRLASGDYQVRVAGVAGQSFVVQASSDSVSWVTVRTDTLLGSYLDFVDTTAAGFRQRFYRVVSLDATYNYQPLALRAPGFQPGNGFLLHLTGMTGQPFRLQASTNLWDWSDLTSGVLEAPAMDFNDSNARDVSRRFYRAAEQ